MKSKTNSNSIEYPIKIRSLQSPTDGPALAELFNAFNKVWEFGFTGDGKNTPEMALELANRAQSFVNYVAENEEGLLIGYCSVHPHYHDKDAAYVGILGVHPDVLGKKVGKKLMIKAIQKTSEKKRVRLDLGTWAGNYKAMPLYKKLGFMWVPETSVSMENAIPKILSCPVFSDFWKKYPDWYAILQRKINQVPDEEKKNGLDVYTYHFQQNDDYLVVWIDRYSKDLLGFDLGLNGKQTMACVEAPINTGYRGLNSSIKLIIQSSEEITSMNINTELPKGLRLSKKFPDQLKTFKDICLENIIEIDVDSALYKQNQKALSPQIILEWDSNKSITLGYGVKTESAIKTNLEYYSSFIRPNYYPKEINLVLENKLKTNLNGKLEIISATNFNPKNNEMSLHIPAEEKILLPIEIENLNSSDKLDLTCKIVYQTDLGVKEDIINETEDYKLTIPILGISRIFVVEDQRKERLVIYNGLENLYLVDLEGGRITFPFHLKGFGIGQNQTLGPPFGFDEFARLFYNWKVTQTKGNLKLLLWSPSEQRPGLILKKSITFEPNSYLVKIEYFVENQESSRSYDLSIRTSHSWIMGPETSLHYIIPFQKKIISTDGINIPRSVADFGTDPTYFHESWIALENKQFKSALGILWYPDQIREIRIGGRDIGTLDFSFRVNAKESVKVAQYYIYLGLGDWHTIRSKFSQLIASSPLDVFHIPNLQHFLEINPRTTCRLNNKTVKIELEVLNHILEPIDGEISFSSEYGDFSPSQIPFKCAGTKLTVVSTTFKAENSFNKPEITILIGIFCLKTFFTKKILITLPSFEGQELTISSEIREDFDGFLLKHPLFEAFSAPSYSAGIVDLRYKGEKGLIYSSFPKMAPGFFFVRDRGGIRFTVAEDYEEIVKGKDQYQFQTKHVSENSYKGLSFLVTDYGSLKKLQDIYSEFVLLAHSNLNIIIFRFILMNKSPITRTQFSALEFSPLIPEDLEITFQANKRTFIRKSSSAGMFADTDLFSPVKLQSKKNQWEMILETPKNVPTQCFIADLRPSRCYIAFLSRLELKPQEKRIYEMKLRLI